MVNQVLASTFTTHLVTQASVNWLGGYTVFCRSLYRLKGNLLHLCHYGLVGSRLARHVHVKTLVYLHILLMQWWWYWAFLCEWRLPFFRSACMILQCKEDLPSLLISGSHQSRQLLLIWMGMMSILAQEQGILLPLTWEQVWCAGMLLYVILFLNTELKTWSYDTFLRMLC